ncbi:MAG: L-rhamnose mutarotase [Bacteroidetes bacterium]|nr:L-rhamnose mutarotase [Bacteroidota bacterium]
MERIAFTMQLHRGFESEYEKRHREIWPELTGLLSEAGITNYSIFLQPATGVLFGYMEVSKANGLAALPHHPIMKKWWDYMKDIMDTHPDHSPISIPLQEVFYLP